MKRLSCGAPRRLLFVGLLSCLSASLALLGCDPKGKGVPTVATVEVVRAPVELEGSGGRHPIPADERAQLSQTVVVPEKGQALIRHDQGARLLLDGGSKAELSDAGLRLYAGRLWVDAAAGAPIRIDGPQVAITASGAGFEVLGSPAELRVTVIRGEVAFASAGQRGVARAGEELRVAATTNQIKPVVLWDDWTGGLGWPDPRRSRGASGLAEVGARRPGDLGEARFPLSVQRLQARTVIEDDLAVTTVEQTFFNPADTTLEGIFRVHLPEGAILSRFAIDRHGRFVDGYVKERETAQRDYQAQVYEGSTKDPALLEWEAPGSFKARLYPLPPGSTRRVLFTYSEWLTPRGEAGTLRSFRYPMAPPPGVRSPLVQEVDIEIDATRAGATELRAGLGAIINKDGNRVILQRTDYQPSADLSVELVGAPRPAGVARVYRVPHQVPSRPGVRGHRDESDYVLIKTTPVAAPAPSTQQPLDLVLLVDVSAATDATHLAMARTLVESLTRHLHPEDRVVLLGADLDAHAVTPAAGKGKPAPEAKLQPATAERLQSLLAQLGETKTAGATDLGAAISQAAAQLMPDRLGAVLYIGDAKPTVGELNLASLRERLLRLPVPLRLYGIGVGAEANLDLLSGLCTLSAGQAYRVADRAAAAETALNIVTHLARPALSRIKVEVGAGVDRVYPRENVSVRAGEPLMILARLRKGLPQQVEVEGVLADKPWKQSFRLEAHELEDSADLRLRWSQARLLQLLDGGGSTEEVAELGVRQNLITPYTSFYVPSEDEVAKIELQTPDLRTAGCSMDRSPARMAREAAPATPSSTASAPAPVVAAEAPADNKPAFRGGKRDRRAADSAEGGEAMKEAAPAAEPEAPAPPPPPPAQAAPMASAAARIAPAEEQARPAAKPMPAKRAKMEMPDDGDVRAAVGGLYGSSGGGPGGADKAAVGYGYIGKSGHGGRAEDRKVATRTKELDARGPKGSRRPPRNLDADDDGSRDESQSSGTLVGVSDGDVTVVVGILRHRPRGCSPASQQPLDERRDLWRERLSQRTSVRRALEVFQDAERGCELPRWYDRRELLRLMLKNCGGPSGMVSLYQHFNDQPEEQEYLRQAILGEVRTPRDLRVIYDGLGLGDEERATLAQEVVRSAKTPAERLKRLADLLRKWPGDLRLRLLRMDTEEQLGDQEAARRTAEEVRRDPYADAQARTAVGELYLRIGDEPAARRAFSEIVEFAPSEPLARRRLGDLYRAHGWFDEAYRQYQTLLALQPGDDAVLILLAMAAAGAGHTEEALGLEQRVISSSEPGSESGLSKIALLFSDLRLAGLREESRQKSDAETLARLQLRSQKVGALSLARPVRVLLSWAHPEADLELLVGGPDESPGPANDLAPQFGLLGWHSDKRASASEPYQIEVRRVDKATGLRYPAELVVIVNEGEKSEQLFRVPLKLDEKTPSARFTLRGGRLEPVVTR